MHSFKSIANARPQNEQVITVNCDHCNGNNIGEMVSVIEKKVTVNYLSVRRQKSIREFLYCSKNHNQTYNNCNG